ncbi:MAG TPA: SDR family NAD(P)-dependent oxidoreductase, partial [Novosphingobium sp.]
MEQRHSGKIAVVTGAAAGIGRAYATRLAAEGAAVAVVDLNTADQTMDAIKAAGGRAIAYRCDVSSPEAVARLGDEVERDFGHCDILVNNAGIFPSCRFEDLDL